MNFYNPVEQPARIKIVHTVRNAPPVDVYLNDRPIIRGLAYRQSTQYIPIPKGMYNMKIYSTSDNQLLLNQNLDVEGSKLITITTKEGTDKIMIKVTEEKMMYDQMMPQDMMPSQMPMPQDMMPGQMQMPQYGMPQDMMPSQMPMPQDMMQGQMQMPQYGMPQDMMPGQMQMPQYGMPQDMMPSQMQMPQYGAQVMEMYGDMPQQSGYNQPMCGCGMGKQPMPYQMPEKRDQMIEEKAKVRFVHFSPNAPAVDITLPDGTVLFRNVPYQAVTDYIRVAPGTYTLQVRPAGMDQVVLTVPDVVINPNDMLSIYAIGLVNGTPGLQAIVFNDMVSTL